MVTPEFFAERVLDQLGINRPQDLLRLDEIAWARGALVSERHLEGAEARLCMFGRKAVITVSTTVANPQRRRFAIAHELGHFEMQHKADVTRLCSNDDFNSWRPGSPKFGLEVLANQFAAALLMPERFFAHRCKQGSPSLDHIETLAREFDTSLTATGIRYVAFSEEPVALVYSESGHIRWFQGSPNFEKLELFIEVGSCLDSSTLADRIFDGQIVPRTSKRVPASAWFTPGGYRADAHVVEQSWGMPSYNAAVTLIWIDDDIEEDVDIW